MKRLGLILIVLLGACETPRDRRPTGAAATGDTAPAAVDTAAAGPKACALLSAAEIRAVTGLSLKDGITTHDYGGSSQCRFDRTDGAQAIMFTVHTQADIANYQSVPGSEAVSGVGDAAVWNEGTSQLAVRVGEGVFSISFFTPPARRQWAVRLAEPVVGKLK